MKAEEVFKCWGVPVFQCLSVDVPSVVSYNTINERVHMRKFFLINTGDYFSSPDKHKKAQTIKVKQPGLEGVLQAIKKSKLLQNFYDESWDDIWVRFKEEGHDGIEYEGSTVEEQLLFIQENVLQGDGDSTRILYELDEGELIFSL